MSYGSTGFIMETQEITFTGEGQRTVSLAGSHPRPPHVAITSIGDDTSSSGDASTGTYDPNFNFFIELITKETFGIQCSGRYFGTVHIIAISTL